jgi:release factor glutamine methyltransferase
VIAARERLARAGLSTDSAAVDAEVLARLALGWDRARYLAHRHEPAPEGFEQTFEALIARRITREPVSQIVGHREFWLRDFEVTRDVLTPRPETELVVEEALRIAGTWDGRGAANGPRRLVDVGTGSGCLAVTLALELPDVEVTATDISAAALAVARRNAERHNAGARIRFVEADLLGGLTPGFDLVVSNPPYVPRRASQALSPDVRDFEPAEALFGGEDGLELIRTLLDQSAAMLQPGGVLVMEFGAGQEEDVRILLSHRPHLALELVRPDYQGIDRVIVARRLQAAS